MKNYNIIIGKLFILFAKPEKNYILFPMKST